VKARENPFASERIIHAIRYTHADGDVGTVVARLAALRYRAAIVGPHGAGKTTLLEDLACELERRGYRTTLMQLLQEIHHRFAVVRIEIPGWLVGEKNRGITRNCTRYSNSLLLTTGQLRRIMIRTTR